MVDTVRMLIRFELSEPVEAILIERLSRDLKFLREKMDSRAPTFFQHCRVIY